MQLSKNNLFVFYVLSFLLGLFFYNIYFDLVLSGKILGVIIVLFLTIYLFTKKYFIILVWMSIGYFCGVFIGYHYGQGLQSNYQLIESYNTGDKYTIVYHIKGVYSIDDYSKVYRASVESIDNIDVEQGIYSLISIPYNFELIPGDIVSATTKIYPFKNSPGFQYREFMASKKIYFKAYINEFSRIDTIAMGYIHRQLYNTRNKFLDIIYKIYPETEAIFLGGILIGARESLPDELKTNFNNSGLTHFIAVSGFNMTILILFLSYVLKYFPVFIRIIGITIAIVGFSMLVGETAPVIRAAIMGLVGYYIMVSGRSGESLAIVLFTALLMILWSPYSLNYDVSLHLSFLAVIGIIYTQDFFKKIFSFLPEFLNIREAFVLTMAALSFTLPIMIFSFGQVSLLAPIANIAVTWTIPLAMLLGFLSVVGYMIVPFIGVIIGYFAWIFLKWDMLMVEFFGTQQYAILRADFGVLAYYFELLYFIVLIFLLLYFKAPKNTP